MALTVILIIIILAFVVAIFFSLDRIRSNPEQKSPQNNPPHQNQSSETYQNPSSDLERPYFPPALGIDRQYQNVHVNMRDRHPVLAYQMAHDQGIVPATLGDPIRIPDVAGPRGLYGDLSPVYDSLIIRPQARPYSEPGPYPGVPIGVPVPAGALKMPPGISLSVGRVDASAPFQEVNTQWQKSGLLTSHHDHSKNEILDLYMRPIAPGQNLWEYQVRDKNGFFIKLDVTRFLEDGDEVRDVIGKHGMGPWKVHMFIQNRYVWV